MLEGTLPAIFDYGALGLLGLFLYFSYTVYKENTKFTQDLTNQMLDISREYAENKRETASAIRDVCRAMEIDRENGKQEHQALMDQHDTLMADHRKITQKLVS